MASAKAPGLEHMTVVAGPGGSSQLKQSPQQVAAEGFYEQNLFISLSISLVSLPDGGKKSPHQRIAWKVGEERAVKPTS